MFCRSCGKQLPDNARFCNQCGEAVRRPVIIPVPEPAIAEPEPAPDPEPVYEPEPAPEPEPVAAPEPEPERPLYRRTPPREQPEDRPLFRPEPEPAVPEENRPLSPWAYFGYGILFSIPVIGLILLIIFSFAGKNINRRNFARSYWCKLIVVLAIELILLVLVFTGILKGPIHAAIAWIRDTGLSLLAKAIG